MVKTYCCEYCNFQTKMKTNYVSHMQTLKHIENAKNDTVKCEYCDRFILKLELATHYSTCSCKSAVDKQIADIVAKNKKEIADIIAKSKKEIEDKLTAYHLSQIAKLDRKHINLTYQKKKEWKDEMQKIKLEQDKIIAVYEEKICKLELERDKIIAVYEEKICKLELEHDKIITTHKEEIHELKQAHEETIKEHKIEIATLKADHNTVLKECGKIATKSIDGMSNALKYANANFTNAPVLTPVENLDFIDSEDIIEDLINSNYKKKLHMHIGDIIISLYKKDNTSDQSFWNTDASRLVYIIRQQIETKNVWTKDIDADRIQQLVINPIIKCCTKLIKARKEVVNKYISKNEKYGMDKSLRKKLQERENLIEICTAITDSKLNKSIIRYITPKFNINDHMAIQTLV
jgi:hypothetical protein